MKVKGIFELPYYVLFSFRTPYLLPTKNGCVFIVLSDNAIFKYQRNNFNFRSYLTSNNKTECGTFELQSDDGIYRSSANCQIVNFISFFYSEQWLLGLQICQYRVRGYRYICNDFSKWSTSGSFRKHVYPLYIWCPIDFEGCCLSILQTCKYRSHFFFLAWRQQLDVAVWVSSSKGRWIVQETIAAICSTSCLCAQSV